MDQILVDVTKLPGVAAGDEAVLIGRQGDEEILARELAEKAETISWHIFTGIGRAGAKALRLRGIASSQRDDRLVERNRYANGLLAKANLDSQAGSKWTLFPREDLATEN